MLAKFLFPKITFFKEKNQALGKKEEKKLRLVFFFFKRI